MWVDDPEWFIAAGLLMLAVGGLIARWLAGLGDDGTTGGNGPPSTGISDERPDFPGRSILAESWTAPPRSKTMLQPNITERGR